MLSRGRPRRPRAQPVRTRPRWKVCRPTPDRHGPRAVAASTTAHSRREVTSAGRSSTLRLRKCNGSGEDCARQAIRLVVDLGLDRGPVPVKDRLAVDGGLAFLASQYESSDAMVDPRPLLDRPVADLLVADTGRIGLLGAATPRGWGARAQKPISPGGRAQNGLAASVTTPVTDPRACVHVQARPATVGDLDVHYHDLGAEPADRLDHPAARGPHPQQTDLTHPRDRQLSPKEGLRERPS